MVADTEPEADGSFVPAHTSATAHVEPVMFSAENCRLAKPI